MNPLKNQSATRAIRALQMGLIAGTVAALLSVALGVVFYLLIPELSINFIFATALASGLGCGAVHAIFGAAA